MCSGNEWEDTLSEKEREDLIAQISLCDGIIIQGGTQNDEYENVIERLGATKVIIPEEASAIQLANEVVSDSIIDYHEVKNNYAMVKMIVNDGYIQKPLKELNARNKFKINIVGIIRNDEFILPMADDVIMSNDIIILVGKNKDVTKFERFINS